AAGVVGRRGAEQPEGRGPVEIGGGEVAGLLPGRRRRGDELLVGGARLVEAPERPQRVGGAPGRDPAETALHPRELAEQGQRGGGVAEEQGRLPRRGDRRGAAG